MRKLLSQVLGLVIGLSFYSMAMAQDKNDILDLLPDSTQMIFSVKSIDDTIKSSGLQEKTFFGEPTEKLKKELRNELGFDLTDIKQLKNLGINISGNAGFILSEFKLKEDVNQEPDFVFSIFLPVSDEAKAIASLKKLFLGNKKVKVTLGKEDNLNYFKKNNEKVYFFSKKGFLFLSFGKSPNVTQFISSLKSDKKLRDHAFYQELSKAIQPDNKDMIFYLNAQSIFSQPFEKLGENAFDSEKQKLLSTFAMLKDYRGILVSMALNKKDLILSMGASLEKGSSILELSKPTSVNRDLILSISEKLGLLLSMSFDPMKYFEFFTKFLGANEMASVNQGFESFKTQYGVDLKHDLLENMDGNINLATFDGKTISMFNYNTVLTIGLKNPDITKAALNKIFEAIPAEQKGMITKNGDHYLINAMVVQISVGFKKNNLVIASSQAMFDKISGQGKGLLNKIKDPKVKEAIGNTVPWILYLSADEINLVVKNLLTMSGGQNQQKSAAQKKQEKDIQNLIAQFEYLFITSDLQDNLATAELVVKTRFKDAFLKSLSHLIGKMK